MKPIPYDEVKDWHKVELVIGKQTGTGEPITTYPKPPLIGDFTILRVDRNTIPKNLHAYDIRHGDDGDFMDMATIEDYVLVNHCGTFVTERKLDLPKWGWLISDCRYI